MVLQRTKIGTCTKVGRRGDVAWTCEKAPGLNLPVCLQELPRIVEVFGTTGELCLELFCELATHVPLEFSLGS